MMHSIKVNFFCDNKPGVDFTSKYFRLESVSAIRLDSYAELELPASKYDYEYLYSLEGIMLHDYNFSEEVIYKVANDNSYEEEMLRIRLLFKDELIARDRPTLITAISRRVSDVLSRISHHEIDSFNLRVFSQNYLRDSLLKNAVFMPELY